MPPESCHSLVAALGPSRVLEMLKYAAYCQQSTAGLNAWSEASNSNSRMTGPGLVESAAFLRSRHSKPDIGCGESRKPALQREQSFKCMVQFERKPAYSLRSWQIGKSGRCTAPGLVTSWFVVGYH